MYMENRELIILIGIPGSGKSTWAARYASEHPGVLVVSSDGIRAELTGTEEYLHPELDGKVFSIVRERVKTGILEHDVIVDATNIHPRDWRTYRELCPEGTVACAKVFDVDPDTAMEYQKGRERQVPREVLDRMWATLQMNLHYVPERFDTMLDSFSSFFEAM